MFEVRVAYRTFIGETRSRRRQRAHTHGSRAHRAAGNAARIVKLSFKHRSSALVYKNTRSCANMRGRIGQRQALVLAGCERKSVQKIEEENHEDDFRYSGVFGRGGGCCLAAGATRCGAAGLWRLRSSGMVVPAAGLWRLWSSGPAVLRRLSPSIRLL